MRKTSASVFLLAMACGLASPALVAQDAPPPGAPAPSGGDQGDTPPPPPRRRGGMMTVDMLKHAIPSITDAQAAQIGQIIKDGRQQSQALRDDQSLSDDDRRAKMREIMTSIRTKVRAVLTADQQAVFDKLPPPGRRPPRPPGGDGDGPPAPPPDAPPPPSGGPAS